jgi:hypothetical protein
VNYAQIWKDCYAKYAESHKLLSNWTAEDFDGLLIDDVLYTIKENQAVLADGPTDLKAIQNTDKLVCFIEIYPSFSHFQVLQNYGRPYNDAGKPTGGYYGFARDALMEEPFSV